MNGKMSTLNAGKTIDHSVKADAGEISIPSYQHGKPYFLPEKKLPSSITFKKQQTIKIVSGPGTGGTARYDNPTSVDQYTANIGYAMARINQA